MMKANAETSSFYFVGNHIRYSYMRNDFISLLDTDTDLTRKLALEYEISPKEDHADGETLRSMSLYIRVSVKSEDGLKLDMVLVNEGCFCMQDTTDRATFDRFLHTSGCATLYSLSRAYVSTITAQALHAGKLNLPMINATTIPERDPAHPLIPLFDYSLTIEGLENKEGR